jgi:hypothetical protein
MALEHKANHFGPCAPLKELPLRVSNNYFNNNSAVNCLYENFNNNNNNNNNNKLFHLQLF